MIQQYKEKVLKGESLTKEEIMKLSEAPLEELAKAANEIREKFCGKSFDICAIINGKSGKCSENCKFCAQSAHYPTKVPVHSLLDSNEMVKQAVYHAEKGILRYSIVTSGRALNEEEIDSVCESVRKIKSAADIEICVSLGLLQETQYKKLKDAGVTRVHNNLETSRRNFPNVCTTHTYEDKINAVKAAKAAGLAVCSGGIMGVGETMEDRIDMALELKALGVHSVPVNMLNAVPGTPYAENKRLTSEDMERIVAVFRFILPDGAIRLAGGRGLIEDKGKKCFLSGANAAISGDMLTTSGISTESDMQLLKELGYQPKCLD